jgi:hypothetical protein
MQTPMPSRTRISIYIAFIVALAVWTGGGVFHSISSHFVWSADPVAYTRAPVPAVPLTNPWPLPTAVLALLTLIGLGVFARYRGAGRREVLVVLGGVFVILVATGVYFVPTLGRLGNPAALSDAQITSISLTWMRLNVVRIVMLLALFVYAQIGLMRLAQARVVPARA